ncbi:M23/M56 family metallopeptidase [Ponticaulis sp.]|uniref:M23/M56 family metallopeptidase n=1 Tax=Ponticaulis sp. TaxID=2020902 RepID=UPI000B625E75|nr:M23/M56 family metallopeptidase [Ponticaulis sp.]MAI91925.1 hypothetical protein [Ponticaulis sp.]OUX96401.1 MAG: hypothetical protein CBB65_15960 [Hyphomonadaceae bacterium TMED5]|tara:strand:- start:3730 stop:5076 length:1347 start_codon:yes stop_codon:yes gene_type:complete
MSDATQILLLVGCLPFIWSGALFLARASLKTAQGHDSFEKLILISMLAAPALGWAAHQFAFQLSSQPLPLPDFSGYFGGFQGAESYVAHPPALLLPTLGQVSEWLGYIYLAGLAFHLVSLFARIIRLVRIELSARSVSGDAPYFVSHHHFSALTTLTGKSILSEALQSRLSHQQIDFILSHESAHALRGDAALFMALAIVDCLFWFNPFARHQTGRCRQAAELDCDRMALAGRPEMRSAYAETLLIALKHTAGNALPCAPAVFSLGQKGDYRMRIESILQPRPKLSKTLKHSVLGGILVTTLSLGSVQFALADSTSSAFALAFLPAEGRMSSSYGPRTHPITHNPAFHHGMDIAAATGTPVRAPASGEVVAAETVGNYGLMVTIDHGNGVRTRYAQLNSASVTAGQHVEAGTQIGTVGASGAATGPHLHFEVWEGETSLNPMDFMTQD